MILWFCSHLMVLNYIKIKSWTPGSQFGWPTIMILSPVTSLNMFFQPLLYLGQTNKRTLIHSFAGAFIISQPSNAKIMGMEYECEMLLRRISSSRVSPLHLELLMHWGSQNLMEELDTMVRSDVEWAVK